MYHTSESLFVQLTWTTLIMLTPNVDSRSNIMNIIPSQSWLMTPLKTNIIIEAKVQSRQFLGEKTDS